MVFKLKIFKNHQLNLCMKFQLRPPCLGNVIPKENTWPCSCGWKPDCAKTAKKLWICTRLDIQIKNSQKLMAWLLPSGCHSSTFPLLRTLKKTVSDFLALSNFWYWENTKRVHNVDTSQHSNSYFIYTTCSALPAKISTNNFLLQKTRFRQSSVLGQRSESEGKPLQTATLEKSQDFFTFLFHRNFFQGSVFLHRWDTVLWFFRNVINAL